MYLAGEEEEEEEVLLPLSSLQAGSASLLCALPFTKAVLICLAPSRIFYLNSNSPFVGNQYSVFLAPLQSCLQFPSSSEIALLLPLLTVTAPSCI